MNLISKVLKDGELPTLNTSVDVSKESVNYIAVALIIVAVIIILLIKIVQPVKK